MNLKKLYIQTYGCQMNVYDSSRMTDLLKPYGYEVTQNEQDADLVILNTCHIREKAAEKVYSRLGQIKELKDLRRAYNDNMVIVVAGCVGQAEGEEIFRRAPFVDIVVGPQSYQTLPELIGRIDRKERRVLNLEFETQPKFDELPEESEPQGVTAYLTVQEGCDKFCKFCCVPYTRGAEFSRPIEQVYREALKLVSQGSKEITLLGQNVTAFHGQDHTGDNWPLSRLISKLSSIQGLERIRYTTSHPRDMKQDIIEVHGNCSKLMPYLHLPFQSGSNKILKDMNRGHTRDAYIKLIQAFREANPDMVFSTDIIVGYPGETDQDFEYTIDLVKKIFYGAQSFSFKYSPRPGTPAATLHDQVPEEVKSERLTILQTLLASQQAEFNNNYVGRTVPVLFDKKGKLPGQLVGRTPHMQLVHVICQEESLNQIRNVKIIAAGRNSLEGILT